MGRGDLGNGGAGGAGGCYDTKVLPAASKRRPTLSTLPTNHLFNPANRCCDTKVTSYLHGFGRQSALVVNGPSSSASVGQAFAFNSQPC